MKVSQAVKKPPWLRPLIGGRLCWHLDTIVVYRLDRFSRHASSAIKLILSLDEVGVAFISVSSLLLIWDEVPFRRTMLAAFAEIAEIERDTIISRVKAGLDAARKGGVLVLLKNL